MELSENCLLWIKNKETQDVEQYYWDKLSEEEQKCFGDIREETLSRQKYISTLEKEYRFFQAAYNALPFPMAIKDEDAKFLSLNESYKTNAQVSFDVLNKVTEEKFTSSVHINQKNRGKSPEFPVNPRSSFWPTV